MDKDKDGLERLLVTGILRNGSLLVKIGNRIAGRWGLTQQQWVLLEALSKEKGELQLSELGKNLLVTKSNITGLIDRLERDGFVKRKREVEDRRVLKAKITEKGLKILRSIRASEVKWNRNAFLDFSNKEKKAYLKLMKKHYEILYRDAYPGRKI
jgi:MarR family 2-MHQ and catechol resistance regulon transcriptional repressor